MHGDVVERDKIGQFQSRGTAGPQRVRCTCATFCSEAWGLTAVRETVGRTEDLRSMAVCMVID